MDDDDGVRAGVSRAVLTVRVDGEFLSCVPFFQCRRPVRVQVAHATFTEVVDHVFGGETKYGCDDGEVASIWFLEVTAIETLMLNDQWFKTDAGRYLQSII